MFDTKRALLLATLSAAAYTTPTGIPGYQDVRLFTSVRGDAEVIVASNAEEIVVAFRGTEPLTVADWWTDLHAGYRRAPDCPGYAHAGFLRAMRRLSPFVTYRLLQEPAKPVWLTGHSMGGALAGLYALQMARWGAERVAGVYSFGAPRFVTGKGAKRLAAAYPGRFWRVQTFGDAVPSLPPWLFGWRHGGKRVVLRSTLRPLKAHGIETYLKRLRA